MRGLLRLGSSAILLLAIMAGGSLLLWVGVPVGWLWIASQFQAETGSLGGAVAIAMVGTVVSIVLVVRLLSALSAAYRRLRVARGLEDTGHFALEAVMVTTAGIALLAFSAWFFLFSGSSPIPLNLSV